MDNMWKNRTLGLRCYSLNDILEESPKIKSDPRATVLSISSTSSLCPDLTELGMDNRSEDVLYLKFDDIGQEYEVDLDLKTENYGLSRSQAKEFIEWFESKVLGEEKNLYLHCEAGLSRSQGFVRFILDCYPDITWLLRMSNPCIYPNQHVVSTLKREWRRKYTPEYEE